MTNTSPADIESNQLTDKEISNLLEFKKILKWMPNGNVGRVFFFNLILVLINIYRYGTTFEGFFYQFIRM